MDKKSIFNQPTRRGRTTHDRPTGVEFTQERFDAVKQSAIESQPISKRITLSQISLTADSILNDVIMIDGKAVACEKSFFRGLSKILKVSTTLERSIRKTDKENKESQIGAQFFTKLIDALKAYSSNTKSDPIHLIANPKTHCVTNIVEGDMHRVSNEGLFKIVERVINEHPNIKILDAMQRGGDVGIKLLAESETDFGKFGNEGLSEIFKFGVSFENFGLATKMGDFAYRLICENGMMGMKTINNFTLSGVSADDIQRMFIHINESEQRGFMPFKFKEHLELSTKCNASLREMYDNYNKARKELKVSADLKDLMELELSDRYFPNILEVSKKLIKKGLDPNGLTEKQMSFIDSGMPMWDLINNMTFLGSHDTGFDFSNRDMLQKFGGKQFHSEYDLAYAGLLKI